MRRLPRGLLAAPVLDWTQLEGVRGITATYQDPRRGRVTAGLLIDGVQWHNHTATAFSIQSGFATELRVWNGEVSLLLADGNEVELCAAVVRCSSLTVNDALEAESKLEEAAEPFQATFDFG